jgi:hypothetical protein
VVDSAHRTDSDEDPELFSSPRRRGVEEGEKLFGYWFKNEKGGRWTLTRETDYLFGSGYRPL